MVCEQGRRGIGVELAGSFPGKSCGEADSSTELTAPSWPCAGTTVGSDSVQGRQRARALQSRTGQGHLRRLLLRDTP